MSIFTVIDSARNAVATVKDWRAYKRRTGKWPLLSITAHALNFVAFVAGVILLVWYGAGNNWSKSRFVLIAILVAVPYVFLWSWLERRVRLNEIRSRRRLAKSKERNK